MLVSRVSPFSGMEHTMELDITEEQLDEYFNSNKLIQDVFPNLSPEEREFIKTGITPDEWNKIFS